jgi:hypothetical protein
MYFLSSGRLCGLLWLALSIRAATVRERFFPSKDVSLEGDRSLTVAALKEHDFVS